MLSNFKKRIAEMGKCVRILFSFAWKEYPIYYLYVVLQIILDSVGPFITIIGTKYLINEIAYPEKRNIENIVLWSVFICIGTFLYRVLLKFVTEKQYYSEDILNTAISVQVGKRCMKMKFEYTENTEVLDDV